MLGLRRIHTFRQMRRFLASAWFPFLVCVVLAAATAGALALLAPTGENVGNSEIVKWIGMGAWAAGPVAGVLSFVAIGIVNLLRRMLRIRGAARVHPFVVLLGVVPWLVFAWILAGEPSFTPIGRAVVPFIARPLLWGSLIATLLTVLLSLPIFFQRRP